GDIDHAIRTAIAGGADPASAYIAAGYGTASAFGLTRNHPKFGTKRGAIAPGWLADLVILDDVKTCKIDSVMKRGKIVGPQTFAQKLTPQFEAARQTVKIGPVTAADFAIPSAGKAVACEFPQDGIPEREKTRAIGLIPGQIVSQALWANVPHHKGFLQATTDVSKLVVMERHGINGNVSKGFITDFGFKPGSWALASTVSHDDHNLVIAGTDDESMAVAANHLRQTGGGYVAVKDGKVIASLDLPLYGLMSDKTPDVVAQELRTLIDTTREQLGGNLHDPFQTLAFVSLSVIPTIKLTDKGLTMFDPANGDQGPHLIS
ncbi:MAG TPA: adenine deaminase C-terminal domain-containing protein, partial [Alphaproteobacteria bacterium]|nr:adenine deaminase C-terminal domain-containing protein [Alphaproteobacteria bacterium]